MPRIPMIVALSIVASVPLGSAVAATVPPSPPGPQDEVYEHATGAHDVIMQVTVSGGLVPTDLGFTTIPSLVITGDGRVVMQGPYPTEFPGPLLPAIVQRAISEEGVQAYLALADQFGMFRHRQYEGNDLILDAPGTTLTITVDDETFTHSAYSLGFGAGPNGEETDPDRAEFSEFVGLAIDPAAVVVDPAGLGEEEPFETDSYLVQARVTDGLEYGPESEPTIVDWPADATVRLADATGCAEVPVGDIEKLLDDADELTLFVDDGVTYHVAATLRTPGRHC